MFGHLCNVIKFLTSFGFKIFFIAKMSTSKSSTHSFYDIVEKCDNHPYPDSIHGSSSKRLNDNLPLLLDNDVKVGLLLSPTVKALKEYNDRFKKPNPFIIEDKYVKFASHLNTFELRTKIVKQLFDTWREEKTFPALSGTH
jgi:hypothetical protein